MCILRFRFDSCHKWRWIDSETGLMETPSYIFVVKTAKIHLKFFVSYKAPRKIFPYNFFKVESIFKWMQYVNKNIILSVVCVKQNKWRALHLKVKMHEYYQVNVDTSRASHAFGTGWYDAYVYSPLWKDCFYRQNSSLIFHQNNSLF